MTGLQRVVGEKLGLPVVDGVGAAVKLAESLVALELTTSRAGSYARPVPKRRTWGAPARTTRDHRPRQ
jgi:allantoin racemase